MIKRFKYDFRYLHVFVIMFKQTDNRMTSAMWNMLKVFERMFGPEFWSNAILEATHWSYSKSKVITLFVHFGNCVYFFSNL